ncbi:MAG: UDP-N-acetylmuramate--L-alanine ligase [Proteobacteria bacterium SG_bin7]|nr:MAG: UDP-N-acetylmuramate--L-alanine ligase [Proteobacteria bacterium SG_bin7]
MRLKHAKFHFIGIGGIGMCGLAQLLRSMGATVSGSDISENAQTKVLASLGVKIYLGHSASNVGDVDVVVYTSAVTFENEELVEARKRRIPIISRAEALAEIMRIKRGIAIAGSHGKTTTTSLVSSIFLEAKLDPTIVVGGRLDQIQSTAMLGHGEWLVAEADESDGSFTKLSPEIVVITNIDNDHLDYFGSFGNLQKAFLTFANLVPFYGRAIVFGDDPLVKDLFLDFRKPVTFFGVKDSNDYVLSGNRGTYDVSRSGRLIGSFTSQFPGKHNALNSLAAILVALEAGISFEIAKLGIEKFTGVDRRFQYKGKKNEISVFDDYGHHPTEIKATLDAMREKFPQKRIVVWFQPHRYSRTQLCWGQFLSCFENSDLLYITDVYAAGEKPIPGITAEQLAIEVKHKNCKFISNKDSDLVIKELKNNLKPNDIFLTLGAGDGWKLGAKLLENL